MISLLWEYRWFTEKRAYCPQPNRSTHRWLCFVTFQSALTVGLWMSCRKLYKSWRRIITQGGKQLRMGARLPCCGQQNIIVFCFNLLRIHVVGKWWCFGFFINPATQKHEILQNKVRTTLIFMWLTSGPKQQLRSAALTFNYLLTGLDTGTNNNYTSPVVLRLVVTWDRPWLDIWTVRRTNKRKISSFCHFSPK